MRCGIWDAMCDENPAGAALAENISSLGDVGYEMQSSRSIF